ncbi:PP2C family protein-serine/threonine phosphatase [Streptomyces sp. XD-27]|uniref:PP2C family protein-serine/threonine phosphatase n=1 Tax=Streptomyces sp. XD-27 TaxID=3062779 RepID=UPI0026F46DB0|nr:PP2C family protein-serine/threonine phosphatase [Streptomyces sp. XD-27]WKX73525.1 PP2C family protein-serine/threonine phosphatase [Streptomyces sp. XD-27]
MPWRARRRRLSNSLFVALLGYIAVVVLVDQLVPRSTRLDVYAAAAPLVAAALCSYRQAVVIAVVDFLVLSGLSGWVPDDPHAVNKITALVGDALLSGVAIVVARLLRDRDALTERLIVTGEAAQRALLRQLPLRSADVVVDGFYVSSQRDALVGGDIYEVVETPYGTRVLVGDVQGKGLRTLGAGAAVLTAFREAAFHRRSLVSGVNAMEQGLRRYNRSTGENEDAAAERFVTALVFGVEQDHPGPRSAQEVPLLLVDCGHVAPYLIRADGTVRELEPESPGLPLGLGELVERPRSVQRVAVPVGSRIFACTDGVTEARDPDGTFYPLADRLGGWASLPTPELLARLRADLDAHTGGRLQDDAAALIMERAAADGSGAGAGTGADADQVSG